MRSVKEQSFGLDSADFDWWGMEQERTKTIDIEMGGNKEQQNEHVSIH